MRFSWLSSSLLLSCVESALAAGDDAWHVHEYEYDFVEALLLIILVTMALGFEILVHHAWEIADHSHFYGKIYLDKVRRHDEPNGHGPHHKKPTVKHAQLTKNLVHRMSGEFMTLGVLALTIFVLNQFEFFDLLADKLGPCGSDYMADHRRLAIESDDCFHLPRSGTDWLHSAEVVHVKLFMAMIFYFILIYLMVSHTNSLIKDLEHVGLRRMEKVQQRKSAKKSRRSLGLDVELQHHQDMRDYFIEKVLSNADSQKILSKRFRVKESLELEDKLERLRKKINSRLSFSGYLSLNVEQGVRDSIQVHVSTWVSIIIIFFACTLLSRLAKMEISHIIPFFIFLSFFFVFFMLFVSRTQNRAIKDFAQSIENDGDYDDIRSQRSCATAHAGSTTLHPRLDHAHTMINSKNGQSFDLDKLEKRPWYERHMSERRAMRALQIVIFFVCFALAENLVDKQKWTHYTMGTLIFSLVYLVIFMLLGWILPSQVPIFLQLTCLPPFFHEFNLEQFLEILDHPQTVYHEVAARMSTRTTQALTELSHPSLEAQRSLENLDLKIAIKELADVIGKCVDFGALADVPNELTTRLRDRGIVLDEEKEDDCGIECSNEDIFCTPTFCLNSSGKLPLEGSAKLSMSSQSIDTQEHNKEIHIGDRVCSLVDKPSWRLKQDDVGTIIDRLDDDAKVIDELGYGYFRIKFDSGVIGDLHRECFQFIQDDDDETMSV